MARSSRCPQLFSSRSRLAARFLVGILCIAAACQAVPGDSPAGDGQPLEDRGIAGLQSSILRVSTNLVSLPVSVTDSGGCEVQGLEMQDFLISEDGRDESVFKVAPSDQSPLRLVLIFDLSGSLYPRFGFEQSAATQFLEKVWRPGDTMSIVAFSDQPRTLLRMSSSLSEAKEVVSRLEPSEGPTAFLDAVALSAGLLRQSTNPETRQAVIALTDGEDNRSRRDLDSTLHAVQRADAIFYSINPAGNSIRLNEMSLQGQSDLTHLARETGGHAFVSANAAELDAVFERIATELRAQYLLSYYSSNSKTDGNYRKISVTIPKRPDLRVRTRLGYYAAPR